MRSPRPADRFRPFLEPLEDRLAPASMTFFVTNNGDSAAPGSGSLRRAILDANANPNDPGVPDRIIFNVANAPVAIDPLMALPTITDAVVLDGTPKPGFEKQEILLFGSMAPAGTDGLTITSGGSTVEGLAINSYETGSCIVLTGAGATNNVVTGNFMGTNFDGSTVFGVLHGVSILAGASHNTIGPGNVLRSGATGNHVQIEGAGTTGNRVVGNSIGWGSDNGVLISGGATGNTVGGPGPVDVNIIDGNITSGVQIAGAGTTGNVVVNNLIGTADGVQADIGNGSGVLLADGASGNIIGGTAAGTRNLISGNTAAGVQIQDGGTSNNTVIGNFIGLNKFGTAALANPIGVLIEGGAGGNSVGGTAPGAGNFISGNSGAGVQIQDAATTSNTVAGNFIGLQADGVTALANGGDGVLIEGGAGSNTVGGTGPGSGNVIAYNSKGVVVVGAGSLGNRIKGNSIYANAGPGIDLGDDGATANDPGDADAGPNNLQNFPVLIAAAGTTVTGTLNSVPNTNFRIEFFATPGGLAGQGQTFLGLADVATDAAGNAGFTATVAAIPDGQVVTATTTSNATGDTSEFSAGLLAPALPPPLPPPPSPPPAPVAPMPVTDVTPSVTLTVLKVRFDRHSRQTRLWVLLTNNGPPLPGPISFVLDGLTRGILLLSSSGITGAMFPVGSPFQDLLLGPLHVVFISGAGPTPILEQAGGSPDLFASGDTRSLLLVFRNPTGRALGFGWRVLAGVGGR
jgi:hypothetical protein